jgi:hypothetical protein
MFLLDSLMISGISWTLETLVTAAEAERDDDTALREQLLAAEMQREMGEITNDEFAEVERDLLARMREIKTRREGGTGPIAFGEGEPMDTSGDGRFQIEATVSGDFYEPADSPHTTIVETEPAHGGIVGTQRGSTMSVIDVEPVHAGTPEGSALPLAASGRTARTIGTPRTTRTKRPAVKAEAKRTARTAGTPRTTRTPRTKRPAVKAGAKRTTRTAGTPRTVRTSRTIRTTSRSKLR